MEFTRSSNSKLVMEKLRMQALSLLCRRKCNLFETIAVLSSRSDQISFLSTQTTEACPEKTYGGETKSLSSRIEKLPRGEAVGAAFRSWMGDGFPVHSAHIFYAVNRMRKLKLEKRALEVMEWVIRERPYKLREQDYSYLLEFTIKFHGISQGQRLFSRIPPEFRNELLYNNLVLACLDKGAIILSLEYMKKMRELGHAISHMVFNHLIILHSSPTRRKLIPKICAQMRADKVAPHVSTYNILMKIEANGHSIEGIDKVYSEMKRANVEPDVVSYCILATAHVVARLYTVADAYVESVEKSVSGTDWLTLDVLIMLYGYLGKGKDVGRIWGMTQGLPQIQTKRYMLAIEAYGRLGQLSRAEELWLEMKSVKESISTEQFNSMISVYSKHGLVEKASKLLIEIERSGCKPNAITYRHLALGCLKADLMGEALKTLERGAEVTTTTKIRRSIPWLETTLSIIDSFAGKGDVENAEKLFGELTEANYTRYTFVYNTLIKAYVKAKIYEPNLLRRMILGGARPDAETYSLMTLAEQFRT